MREYAALTILVVVLIVIGAVYVTDSIACAMDNMANTIAESSTHG